MTHNLDNVELMEQFLREGYALIADHQRRFASGTFDANLASTQLTELFAPLTTRDAVNHYPEWQPHLQSRVEVRFDGEESMPGGMINRFHRNAAGVIGEYSHDANIGFVDLQTKQPLPEGTMLVTEVLLGTDIFGDKSNDALNGLIDVYLAGHQICARCYEAHANAWCGDTDPGNKVQNLIIATAKRLFPEMAPHVQTMMKRLGY